MNNISLFLTQVTNKSQSLRLELIDDLYNLTEECEGSIELHEKMLSDEFKTEFYFKGFYLINGNLIIKGERHFNNKIVLWENPIEEYELDQILQFISHLTIFE